MVKMYSDDRTPINELKKSVKKFIVERGWEKYHKPKDIAEAICIEAAELLELFQWRTHEEISELLKNSEYIGKISEEIADISIYILSLTNILGIDLSKNIIEKIRKNEGKYPIEKYYGRARIQ